jgi:hypothetical protein
MFKVFGVEYPPEKYQDLADELRAKIPLLNAQEFHRLIEELGNNTPEDNLAFLPYFRNTSYKGEKDA